MKPKPQMSFRHTGPKDPRGPVSPSLSYDNISEASRFLLSTERDDFDSNTSSRGENVTNICPTRESGPAVQIISHKCVFVYISSMFLGILPYYCLVFGPFITQRWTC